MDFPSIWIKSNMRPIFRDSPKDKLARRKASEAEIKVQRCLEKLSIPEWYLNSSSKPPKILMNTTPIELRPAPWKSENNKQQNTNASRILQKYYDSPKTNGKPMNASYGGVTSSKPVSPQNFNNTVSVLTKKSPSKKRESNKKITKLKKSSHISKSFPKISPSRKIKHINLVFPQKELAPDEKLDPSLDISISGVLKKCKAKQRASLKPALLDLPLISPKLADNIFVKQDKLHRQNKTSSSFSTSSTTTSNNNSSNTTTSNNNSNNTTTSNNNSNNTTTNSNTSVSNSPVKNLNPYASGVNPSMSANNSPLTNQNSRKEVNHEQSSFDQEDSVNLNDTPIPAPRTFINNFGKFSYLCSPSTLKSPGLLKTINENSEDPPDHPPPPPPLEISTATFTRTKGKSPIILQKEMEEEEAKKSKGKSSTLRQSKFKEQEKEVEKSEWISPILPQTELKDQKNEVNRSQKMFTIQQMKLKQQELETELFQGKSPIIPISRQTESKKEVEVKRRENKSSILRQPKLEEQKKEGKRSERKSPILPPTELKEFMKIKQREFTENLFQKHSSIERQSNSKQPEKEVKKFERKSPILRQTELKEENQFEEKSPSLSYTKVRHEETKDVNWSEPNLNCDTSLIGDIVEELKKKCQLRTRESGIPRSLRRFVKKLVQVLERSNADDENNSIVISSSSSSSSSSAASNNNNHLVDDFEDDELGSACEVLSTSSGVMSSGSIFLKNSDGEDLISSISCSPDYDWSMEAIVNIDETRYQKNADIDDSISIPKKLPHLPRSSTLLSVYCRSIHSGRSSARSSERSFYKSPSISPIRRPQIHTSKLIKE